MSDLPIDDEEFEIEIRIRNNRLRSARERLGLRPTELAQQADIVPQEYQMLEAMEVHVLEQGYNRGYGRGGRYRESIAKLAAYHGVPISKLFPDELLAYPIPAKLTRKVTAKVLSEILAQLLRTCATVGCLSPAVAMPRITLRVGGASVSITVDDVQLCRTCSLDWNWAAYFTPERRMQLTDAFWRKGHLAADWSNVSFFMVDIHNPASILSSLHAVQF